MQDLRIKPDGSNNKRNPTTIKRVDRKGSHSTPAKAMMFVVMSLMICYLPYFPIGLINVYVRNIAKRDPGELLDVLMLGHTCWLV